MDREGCRAPPPATATGCFPSPASPARSRSPTDFAPTSQPSLEWNGLTY